VRAQPLTQTTSRTTRLALIAGAAAALVAGAAGPAGAAAGPTVENWSFGSFFGGTCTCFADVDGDGRADAVAIGNGPTVVRRSQDNQFSFTRENWTDGPASGKHATALADVTGDGKADLVAVNDNDVVVRRSDGVRFSDPERWTTDRFRGDADVFRGGLIEADLGTYFADVDGDRKADAIAVRNDTVIVARSRGDEFGPDEDWTFGPYFGRWVTAFADVTGDGMADAIVVNDGGITVRRSTGSGFSGNETWTFELFLGFASAGGFNIRGVVPFADMDGDGKADAIVVGGDRIQVRRSVGDFLDFSQDWTTNPFFGNRATSFADVTGDGKADSIAVNNNGIFVRRSF